jgi:hypothetical protein
VAPASQYDEIQILVRHRRDFTSRNPRFAAGSFVRWRATYGATAQWRPVMTRLPRIRPATLRAMRDGAIVACLVLAVAHLFGLLNIGVDAYSYWSLDPSSPYTSAQPGTLKAFFYSPAFAQLTTPIHVLPWTVFIAAWTVLLTAALVWQAGMWTAIALLLFPVFVDLTVANIHLLMGAAIVIGFRYPWTWSFILLTKITPGVGLLWFAFRREWRSLAIALAATGAIAAVSFLYRPDLWRAWFDLLVAASRAPDMDFIVPIPVWYRLPISAAIVAWGARTNRPWTVVLASCISIPVLELNAFAMLVAIIPLIDPASAKSPAAAWLRRTEQRRPLEVAATA